MRRYLLVVFGLLWAASALADYPGDPVPSPTLSVDDLRPYRFEPTDPIQLVYCHNWVVEMRPIHLADERVWPRPAHLAYIEIRKVRLSDADGLGAGGVQVPYTPLRLMTTCNTFISTQDTMFTLDTVTGGDDWFNVWWPPGEDLPSLIYQNDHFHFQVRTPHNFASMDDPRTLEIHFTNLSDSTSARVVNVFFDPEHNDLPLPHPPFFTTSADGWLKFDGSELQPVTPAMLDSMNAITGPPHRPRLNTPPKPIYVVVEPQHHINVGNLLGMATLGAIFAIFDLPEFGAAEEEGAAITTGRVLASEEAAGSRMAVGEILDDEAAEATTVATGRPKIPGPTPSVRVPTWRLRPMTFRLAGLFKSAAADYVVTETGVVQEVGFLGFRMNVGVIAEDGAIYRISLLGRGPKVGSISVDGRAVLNPRGHVLGLTRP